jgi:uncharacterized SAM-binding protein YcdF (DUF218 family)
MFFYFGKIAGVVFGPLGIVVILMLAALIFYRRPRLGRGLLITAVVLLWGMSAGMFSDPLLRALEYRVPSVSLENAPAEPVIIVLGGFLNTPTRARPHPVLTHSADRLVQAFRLYRAGKAPLILISSGTVPMFGVGTETESEAARTMLQEWGVPASAILVETHSQSTHENAVFSARLLAERGIRSALLVTSASHMPRAFACFRKAGMDVVACPADYLTGWAPADLPFRVLPHTEALNDTAAAFHEYMGLFLYKLRGWA